MCSMQSMMHKRNEAYAGLGYLWFLCTLCTCHRLPRVVGPQDNQGDCKMGRAKLTISPSLRSKRFRGTRVKDREKNGVSKRAGRGGEERKETLADKPWDFENRPPGLSCLSSRTNI